MNKEERFSDGEEPFIFLNEHVILAPYDDVRPEAMKWYGDEAMQLLVNGVERAYSQEEVQQMYRFQNENGELFYIEYQDDDHEVHTIGDVWLAEYDFSIVLDPAYQGKGIGRLVLQYFMELKRRRGEQHMVVREVYSYNEGSNALFQKNGFEVFTTSKGGCSYIKRLC